VRAPLRVLIVEDSEDDAALLVRALRLGGYEPDFLRVDTPEAMRSALAGREWDIVIADYTMPRFSGLAALEVTQMSGLDLPFILMSGSIGEDIAVTAMKAGAHDYILKGQPARLVPAVERELREASVRRERKKAERALRESEVRKIAVLESALDCIVTMDYEGKIVEFNPAAERVFGYKRGETIGKDLAEMIIPPSLRETHRRGLAHFLSTGEGPLLGKQIETTAMRADGSEFPIELALTRVSLEGPPLFTGFIRDITERKTQAAILEYHATHDPLTDLPNRVFLHERLEQIFLEGQMDSSPTALLLIDLDRFREINDTLGHHRGDLVIKEVCHRLQGVLRKSDMVARLGGDEFGLLVPKADADDAVLVARKIFEAFEPPLSVEGLPIIVEASIGIALYPDHGANADSLFQRADVAMYAAKQTGSGFSVYNADQDHHSPRKLALMGELRHAIENNELILHYQPKINLRTGRIVGVEALVRWRHPERGMIPPDQFIAPAERTGLIRPLTLWVLNTALDQCQLWHKQGLELAVAANISARSLQDPKLSDLISGLFETRKTPFRSLALEITESMIMAEPMRALEILTQIHKMGVRLSIDDFGTGYSSLAYLKKLPVDEIKIDKSFVIDMVANSDDAMIVRSTIHLAHNLGLKVVAEGVETEEARVRLAELGCDTAQGYYFSRPLPAEELTRWIRAQSK
jgi:diguanylate cyclase (GGDEF)-like protein/PAS domain S-box-containing protein